MKRLWSAFCAWFDPETWPEWLVEFDEDGKYARLEREHELRERGLPVPPPPPQVND